MVLERAIQEKIIEIIHTSLPDVELWVFGSRVSGRQLKRFSDIDIVIMAAENITLETKTQIEDSLSFSDIPFKVDVLYWNELSENFRGKILDSYEILFKKG